MGMGVICLLPLDSGILVSDFGASRPLSTSRFLNPVSLSCAQVWTLRRRDASELSACDYVGQRGKRVLLRFCTVLTFSSVIGALQEPVPINLVLLK
jgi:hypothetical protein